MTSNKLFWSMTIVISMVHTRVSAQPFLVNGISEQSSSENIVFVDDIVKALCVENWDADGDGELSFNEAAKVTELGDVFRGNANIISFDELSYFKKLHSIGNRAFEDCKNLNSVTLPTGIQYIGDYAFYGCSNLKEVNYEQVDTQSLWRKKVLVESFVSVNELYSPSRTNIVNEVLADENYSTKAISVSHHVQGFGNDTYFMPCDSTYKTWAKVVGIPSFMMNRTPFNYNKAVDYINGSVLCDFANSQGLQYYIDTICSYPSHVRINMAASRIDNNSVYLTVRGEKDNAYNYSNTRLTVYLIEDVVHESQNGTAHYKIKRYYNNTWGDEVSWNNNEFEKSYNIDISSQWNDSNLSIVCFINRYSPSNNLNGTIENAESIVCPTIDNTPITSSDQRDLISIGRYSFCGCKQLNSIKIPSTVEEIGRGAFEGASNLTDVISEMSTPINIESNTFSNRQNAVLHVPFGTKELYLQASYWKDFLSVEETGSVLVSEYPYTETFDDVTKEMVVPDGWLSTTTAEWENRHWGPLSTEKAYGGTGVSMFTFFMPAGNCSTLTSPEFKLPKAKDLFITFVWGDCHPADLIKDDTGTSRKQNVEGGNGYSDVVFEIFCDGEWKQAAYLSENYNTDGNTKYWRDEKVDLTEYIGKKVKFRWINNSYAGGHRGAGLDNVMIDGFFEVSNDSLYIDDVNLQTGKCQDLSIQLINDEPIIMAEFYLQLPEVVTVSTDKDGNPIATLNVDRCDNTHTVTISHNGSGLYHFLCYSNANSPFFGNNGEIVHLELECDNAETGVYKGVLKDILLSDMNKRPVELPDFAFDINIRDYKLGDIDNNDKINGIDIIDIIELIMTSTYAIAADLYPKDVPDGVINGMDLVEEVELVMTQPLVQGIPPFMRPNDSLNLEHSDDGSWNVGIRTFEKFILAQMTIELPEGEHLLGVRTDNTHSVLWRQIDSNRYMIVCFSSTNQPFVNNQDLISILCTNGSCVKVSDILLVDSSKKEHLYVFEKSAATSIEEWKNEPTRKTIYDLQGRMVSSGKKETKGLYIINKTKAVIK